uniref:C2H2-type domain-containing protein n=1 Tax=Pygocentrus nattereri TaxID=42514 RepID=A0A3B4DIX0_PYGNA
MTDKKRRMELHPSGAPNSEAGGSTVSMEEPVNQRGAHNHWTEGASSEETLTLKQEEEECQDIKPTLLPKIEPIQHQEEGGGGQEGQKSLSVVIKTEQGCPEESSSFIHGGEDNNVLQKSEDVFSMSPFCETPSISKETWQNQQTLEEDVHSSLIIIKVEPDEQEMNDQQTHHEVKEVSNQPTVRKTEPGCAYSDEEPLCEKRGKEDNENLNTSGECSQPTVEEHKGLKSYSCSECGRTFSQSSSFYRHMRIHTGERPFQCSQCNKTFVQSNTFKIHQRIHTGEKPYKCSDCGKNFKRLDSLRIHQRTHTGEKPYKCSHCPKTFTRLHILQNHERIHTGEKPYQCSHCSKTFTRSSVYQVHQRTHTGERPYKCSVCEKQFLNLSNLINHKRKHTKERPYRCSQCDRTFIQLAHLTSHRRTHTGEKPYHCNICGKSYGASYTLFCHQKKHKLSPASS